MNFEDKSIKLTAFKVELNDSPGEMLKLARMQAAKPIGHIPVDLETVDVGWAAGRMELDTELQPKNCIIGEYLYLSLRSARYKINSELLKAYTRKLLADWLEANPDREYVPSKVKRELKDDAIQALLKRASLCITTIPVIVCPNGTVYTGAASGGEIDSLNEFFYKTFRLELQQIDAAALIGDKGNDLNGTTGREFLVWLLWQSEKNPHARFWLDAPFEFADDNDEQCDHATARGKQVANSKEARAALGRGKGLRKAKLTLVGKTNAAEAWNFTFNADLFAFTGLKLPQGEEMAPDGVFIERIDMIAELLAWVADSFAEFWDEYEFEDYMPRKGVWLAER